MSLIDSRRAHGETRLGNLRASLDDGEELLSNKACVYVTGSFGRGEASAFSDLDLFIVGLTQANEGGGENRLFSPLDEALLKADLIRAADRLAFPEFDRDGEFLVHHSVADLVGTLGHPTDDAVNTFTARLLLLLESKPLFGSAAYAQVIDQVIQAYWVDYEGHEAAFVPGYLTNDILRLWRTFCVNYEAFTKREPDRERAKRRLKNYKLRHSRLLTCYSAVAHLLELFRREGTVTPEGARAMVGMTPTERIEALFDSAGGDNARRCLELYERFLGETDASKDALLERFLNDAERRQLSSAEGEFGDEMYALLDSIDPGSRLFRLLVI